MKYDCIVVLGPTASGKTRLACEIAYDLNGEIISADSRQVYKHLNIGTGKDLNEYKINNRQIPFHLIDIVEPEEQFYLHQFIEELGKAFDKIKSNHKLPIICGGTGLYLDALRKDFSFTQIPENLILRKELEALEKEELLQRLKIYPDAFTKTIDASSKKRIIRGIEIAEYRQLHPNLKEKPPFYKPYFIGIKPEIEKRRDLIYQRLLKRFDEGLIEEVIALNKNGLSFRRLELLGLEYKFITYFLQEKITKDEMILLLQTAIFQFAKRQMTWFRKMEKEGVKINWIDSDKSKIEILKELRQIFKK
jgi:tRNA dimethylallyltransferase